MPVGEIAEGTSIFVGASNVVGSAGLIFIIVLLTFVAEIFLILQIVGNKERLRYVERLTTTRKIKTKITVQIISAIGIALAAEIVVAMLLSST